MASNSKKRTGKSGIASGDSNNKFASGLMDTTKAAAPMIVVTTAAASPETGE
jgi:hypothetical protein